ncbi:hypothetical protein [Flavobacterium sp. T12S277]|uniref:hypothetical protein n=1 Tax=Flavobacterium sp. T12S277 TaxID=3402752 RepID=UPI003AE9967E
MKFFILLILLIGTAGYSQKIECAKFKNGKFFSRAFPNEYTIRKDSIEETYANNKLESVWDVKWLSDCKYEIVCKKNYGSDPIAIGMKFIYTIFATEEDCFYVSIWYSNEEYPDGKTFQRGLCIKED